jgi:hypothetical protein
MVGLTPYRRLGPATTWPDTSKEPPSETHLHGARARNRARGLTPELLPTPAELCDPLAIVAAFVMMFVSAVPASAAIPPPTVSKQVNGGDGVTCTLSAKSLGYTVGGSGPTTQYRASIDCGSHRRDIGYIQVEGAYFKDTSSGSSWSKSKTKTSCGTVFYCAVTENGPYFGGGIYCAYAHVVIGSNPIAHLGPYEAGPACVKL